MKHFLRLILCCIVCSTQAQNKDTEPFPPLEKARNIFEHEQLLRDWQERFPKARGWKWAARHEHELLKRADANGTLPSGEVLLDAAHQLEQSQSLTPQARTAQNPTWSPVGPYGSTTLEGIGRINCIAFHPTDANTYYLGFAQGGIWKTTNGGKSYTPIGDQLPILRIGAIAIDPNNPQVLYISLSDFAYVGYDLYTADRKRNTHYGLGVWKSTDGGTTWQPTGLRNTLEENTRSLTRSIWVNPRNSLEVVVVGSKGIFKSFDGGQAWQQVQGAFTSQLIQDPSDPSVLYAAGMYVHTVRTGTAGVLKSSDAGNTWRTLNTQIPGNLAQRVEIGISPSNPSVLYAVTCNTNNTFEGFYRSKNAGQTWEKAPVSGINLLGDSPAGSYGQGLYDLTILVHPTNPNKVYVGGLTMFETADGGNTWTQTFDYGSYIHPDQHQLAYNPLNKTYYLCNDGGLYTTKGIVPNRTQNLSNWQFVCDGINATSCYRLGVAPSANLLVTGSQDNNTYLGGSNTPWRNIFGGDGMECLITNSEIYASYQYGTIIGTTPDFQRSFQIFPPITGDDTGEWTTPYVWAKQSQQIIVAGGNVHRVPVGRNATALVRISDFPKIGNTRYAALSSALAVAQSAPNVIYVAKRAQPLYNVPAQVYRTTNGGLRWEDITSGLYSQSYVTSLSVDEQNPERVWATLSNFVTGEKVYYSNNGGKNWQNISYNLPNIPANALAYDSNGVLYVGMDVGIYYLTEGSQTWKPFATNLPNVIINELEIHPDTQKLYAATFGRGLWVADLLQPTASKAAAFYDMEATIYPNPSSGNVTLKANYDQVEAIEVIDVLGRTVAENALPPKVLRFGKAFDWTGLSSGLYFVRLKQGKLTKVLKMWKQ